eukprot:4223624-Pyramimonas_sp.AAC.1
MLARGPPPRAPPYSTTHNFVRLVLRPRPSAPRLGALQCDGLPQFDGLGHVRRATSRGNASRASSRLCCSGQMTAQPPAEVWRAVPPA